MFRIAVVWKTARYIANDLVSFFPVVFLFLLMVVIYWSVMSCHASNTMSTSVGRKTNPSKMY